VQCILLHPDSGYSAYDIDGNGVIQYLEYEALSQYLLQDKNKGGSTLFATGEVLASILPESPEHMRIPTIINKISGDGTLGSNLALELYSGIWQYLAIIAGVKFYKLIPGKFT
jgi:hypothetical protein